MRKLGNHTLRAALLGSAAVAATIFGSSGAFAQNCTATPLRPGFQQIGNLAAATASSVASSIGNVGTAFLSQQTSAFVAAPGNAAPGTQGGGVWVRGVGGEVEINSFTTTAAAQTPVINPAIDSGTINCSSTERLTFVGVQVGQDISRLNLGGYNVHLGTTAGYLEAKGSELEGPGTFRTKFEVPFVGMYAVVTNGGFFADANLRFDYYNVELNDPTLGLFNQPISAQGVSVTGGAGYNLALDNGWFIEPSAGAILSRTDVDPFSGVGLSAPALGNNLSGSFTVKPIDSAIGRATLRVGRSFTTGNLALQPFATASFFHEFAGDVESNYTTCVNCAFVGAVPVTAAFNSQTSRVGSYGQYSLGVAGQIIDTGWLGFVRGDYRNGENIEGWTLNAGLRYQYNPDKVNAGVFKAPVVTALPVTWSGFYLGAYFGAGYGNSDAGFTGFSTTEARVAGWLGGGQLGYNYQFGSYLLGVEGDYGATNLHGARTCGADNGLDAGGVPGGFSPFFMTCGSDIDSIATVAARIGFTWDRTLFYIKAGGAWADETVSANCIIGPNNNAANPRQCRNPALVLVDHTDASATRLGWMVGYGTEYALTQNWSAKAEYKYIDFGSHDYAGSDGSTLTSDLHVSTVTVGVNYRFSPWAAPVVAKY